MTDALKRMKVIITILSILLGMSLAALAGVIIYFLHDPQSATATIPDNYIEPAVVGGQDVKNKSTQPKVDLVTLSASVPVGNPFGSIPMKTLSKTVITSDRANLTVISIFKKQASDSEPFICGNMFPGDSETNSYLVEVSHKGTVTVRFHADIREGYEKLSEVLGCRVVLREENKLLYDGLMRDMPESLDHRITSVFGKTTELTYDITVYLNTSVGNEYMNKELVADFRWWVGASGEVPYPPVTDTDETDPSDTTRPTDTADSENTTGSEDTSHPEHTTGPQDTADPEYTTGPDRETDPEDTKDSGPDDGELIDPPQTGDNFHICIWFWIAVISLLINIILLLPRRRRIYGEEEYG